MQGWYYNGVYGKIMRTHVAHFSWFRLGVACWAITRNTMHDSKMATAELDAEALSCCAAPVAVR